jgi:hypothetical protein
VSGWKSFYVFVCFLALLETEARALRMPNKGYATEPTKSLKVKTFPCLDVINLTLIDAKNEALISTRDMFIN